MKPYFYDMMIAVGMTDPRFIQIAEEDYLRDKTVIQSSKALNQLLTRLAEEYPRWTLPKRSPQELLAVMRAHYERYTWMEKHGCFYLSPEEPGYPDIMLRMNKRTGSRKGHYFPGVIYCKGNRALLTQRLHILTCSSQPYGIEVSKAMTGILEVMRSEECHPIIPIATSSSWELVKESLKQSAVPVIVLDKGMDSYLERSDQKEQSLIDETLQQGGLLMTNRKVGDNDPLKFPMQYLQYFMFALVTRMHMLQVHPTDNSRFLMEAALNHSVRVCLLSQQKLPPRLPVYYRQLPTIVQQLPLTEWLRL